MNYTMKNKKKNQLKNQKQLQNYQRNQNSKLDEGNDDMVEDLRF
ncbi:hypothetical protein DDB_G0269524 [Dictyostelium discoideum AX4]|uniref:Uncharacterized protein n=1 Tax=Dictyostelium discoideum TaxID=44689 RepID=Q55DT9_DICDI|nr:hypothetical protein DDB_G0269524 [Dictyostelium discoideum AX4]EAL72112.1 hypothetical protein DDB_G0269524 [Dictyostelium discoideum AX4]|eukprot:XP_646042.1 hypothetical protein DDB_G0269524 [Dictyostelium discoideum AX4]